MRRRDFMTLMGGAAVAWPLAARAQQGGKLPIIGFMGASSRSAIDRYVAALVQRLHERGWINGHTVAIEYRWAEGHFERLAEIVSEFVRMKVDIIVTHSTVAVIAAKQATSIIPIVFAVAADPVGTGLVASLSAETLPASQFNNLILPPNGSNCCVKWFLIFSGSRSSSILTARERS